MKDRNNPAADVVIVVLVLIAALVYGLLFKYYLGM